MAQNVGFVCPGAKTNAHDRIQLHTRPVADHIGAEHGCSLIGTKRVSRLGVDLSEHFGDLSATSTSFQQVTVTEETTHFETIQLTNPSEKTQYFLKWRLMDVITVLSTSADWPTPLASIVLAQAPVLVGGPYYAP